jgi:DNA-binding NarL/FixJ family response regulator
MGKERHGATEREEQVLSLYDAGFGKEEIATRLNLSTQYVYQVMHRMSLQDTNSDKKFWAMIRDGSARLGARIAEVHGG